MFASAAERYAGNPAFRLKLALIAVAGVNLIVFRFGTYRRVSGWADQVRPPVAPRLAGALSLALWLAIVASGRWIAS